MEGSCAGYKHTISLKIHRFSIFNVKELFGFRPEEGELMQQTSDFLERMLGLYWDNAMPVVMVDIIPAGAEAILSGGYLEPQKLQDALRSLYYEYKRVHKSLDDYLAKLGRYVGQLPASPDMASCDIERMAAQLDGTLEKRRELEGYTLWLLSQHHPLKKGALRWEHMGSYTSTRVELYKPVIVKVSEEFRKYLHEVKEIITCYWLTTGMLHLGRDNEDRRWLDFDQVEKSLVNQLALLATRNYCKNGSGSLNRCFQGLINAIGDHEGVWLAWQDFDKDQLKAAIHLARNRTGGLTLRGFEQILQEIRVLY